MIQIHQHLSLWLGSTYHSFLVSKILLEYNKLKKICNFKDIFYLRVWKEQGIRLQQYICLFMFSFCVFESIFMPCSHSEPNQLNILFPVRTYNCFHWAYSRIEGWHRRPNASNTSSLVVWKCKNLSKYCFKYVQAVHACVLTGHCSKNIATLESRAWLFEKMCVISTRLDMFEF